jgi:hypothetical protein
MNFAEFPLDVPIWFLIAIFLTWLTLTVTQLYGIYTCFMKKWYLGAAALLIPGFALVIGAFKFFKKDLLS